MVKLGKQTESSYSEVYVCVQLMGFLKKRGKEKCTWGGGWRNSFPPATAVHLMQVRYGPQLFSETPESNVLPLLEYLAVH